RLGKKSGGTASDTAVPPSPEGSGPLRDQARDLEEGGRRGRRFWRSQAAAVLRRLAYYLRHRPNTVRIRRWTATSVSDGFWQALEQVKVAEEVGFSHVFSVEHHFLDQFSVASAPEVWLAAVAQHTSKIRIGHGVRLLPFEGQQAD